VIESQFYDTKNLQFHKHHANSLPSLIFHLHWVLYCFIFFTFSLHFIWALCIALLLALTPKLGLPPNHSCFCLLPFTPMLCGSQIVHLGYREDLAKWIKILFVLCITSLGIVCFDYYMLGSKFWVWRLTSNWD